MFSSYSVSWAAGVYVGTRPIRIVAGSRADHDGFASGIHEYQRGSEFDADNRVSIAVRQCGWILYVGQSLGDGSITQHFPASFGEGMKTRRLILEEKVFEFGRYGATFESVVCWRGNRWPLISWYHGG